MLNKYIYAEATQDYWPQIKTVSAKSYNDAVEILITRYSEELDDDDIANTIDNWDQLRTYLNSNYSIDLSDLEIYEEL